MISWDDIKIFQAVATAQTMSNASQTLNLSQPQVSRRINHLERQLGVRLFERTASGLRLTNAGENLRKTSSAMAEEADRVMRCLPSLTNQGKRRVRIAVDEVREAFIAPHFAHLMTMAPDVELELYSHHRDLKQSLREADLQIRSWFPNSGNLKTRKLGDMAFGIFASQTYWKNRIHLGKTDIFSQCDWIGFAPDHLWFTNEKGWMDRHLKVKPMFLCNTATSLLHAIEADNGLAILPVFLGKRSAHLVQIDITLPELCVPDYLILHDDLVNDPTIRTMIDALVALYQSHHDMLNPAS